MYRLPLALNKDMKEVFTKIKKKTKKRSGFTLAETLIAVLILLMVSSVIATGIPAAASAYQKVVDSANAEVLLSTTITTLRNELTTAENITTPGDGSITYYNASRRSYSKIFVDNNTKEGIQFIRFYNKVIDPNAETSTAAAERLISTSVSTKELYVTYSSVGYSGGVVTFSNLRVLKSTETASASADKGQTLSIRVISD